MTVNDAMHIMGLDLPLNTESATLTLPDNQNPVQVNVVALRPLLVPLLIEDYRVEAWVPVATAHLVDGSMIEVWFDGRMIRDEDFYHREVCRFQLYAAFVGEEEIDLPGKFWGEVEEKLNNL